MDTQSTKNPVVLGWADRAACTLPASERPLRLAEFDALFASDLLLLARTSETSARMEIAGDALRAEQVRQLAERESACCSFFTFDIAALDVGRVALDVRVPAAYADVLNELVARADHVLGGAS